MQIHVTKDIEHKSCPSVWKIDSFLSKSYIEIIEPLSVIFKICLQLLMNDVRAMYFNKYLYNLWFCYSFRQFNALQYIYLHHF